MTNMRDASQEIVPGLHLPAARLAGWVGREIGITLADFGQPLFCGLGTDTSVASARAALDVVVYVWNAHVLAMPAWGQPWHLDRLQRLTGAGAGTEAAAGMDAAADTVGLLGERRAGPRFRDDPRAIGGAAIDRCGDTWVVTCNSVLPRSLWTPRRALP